MLSQLFQQRWQRGGDLRELRFLRRHVESADITFRILRAQNLQHVGVDGVSSRVASICARNDASWMAPAATLCSA